MHEIEKAAGPAALDEFPLPDCLERADGGIRIRGHRVSFGSFLCAYFSSDHPDAAAVGERFPTVPAATIDALFEFCGRNLPRVRQYHAEQEATADRHYETARAGAPSLAKLKSRRDRGS